jgi:hypothetical protein
MAGGRYLAQPGRVRRGLLVAAVVVALAGLGLWRWGRGSRTAAYWNQVHTLSRQAASIKDQASLEDAVRVLRATEERLGSLNTQGVDPLAVEAARHLQEALVAARRCAGQARWMNEHPVRTVASEVVGQSAREKLRARLVGLRERSTEAYLFARSAHGKLSSQYPLRTFAAPIRPDVEAVNELIAQLDQEKEDLESLYDIAFLVGGLARLFVGSD